MLYDEDRSLVESIYPMRFDDVYGALIGMSAKDKEQHYGAKR